MVNLTKNLVLVFFVWIVTWIYMFYVQQIPELATVDIAAITQSFIQNQAQKKLNPEAKQQAVKHFSQQLETALVELSHQHKRIVLLPKEAVLSGAQDYTEQVRNLMHLES